MKDTLLYVLFISAIVALFGFAFSFSQEQTPDGEQIFLDNKCNKCHSVTSMDITSKKNDAVDLSDAGSAGDVEFLKSFLLKEADIDDTSHKIKFKGSEEELNTLAEWLASLKTETAK
jgi:cytochrome c553